MPLTLALGRQRHVYLCEFEASLVDTVSSRPGKSVCYTKKPCFGRKRRKEGRKKGRKEGRKKIVPIGSYI